MGRPAHRTEPFETTGRPPGIPFIVGNEAAERFSFYGMKAILAVFMTKFLMNAAGQPDHMSEAQATTWIHAFGASVYFFPILGALFSDIVLGKYRTIITLSIVYCLGHLALALDDTRAGLAIGLTLIAVGSGGIKPCVSAHVGDQFGAQNAHRLSRTMGWFYWCINFGAFFSTMLTPLLLEKVGPSVAFGVPGGLMLIATWVFWAGRNKFVHIPPAGIGFVREAFGPDGRRALAGLVPIYLLVAVYWALYDQTGSSWVLQAEKMDLRWLGVTWLSSQVQAVNPILILAFIPLFNRVIFPAVNRVYQLTPLRKMVIGFVLAASSFLICAHVETLLAGGAKPTVGWQIFAYVVITTSEVLVSITCLEFSYTQAPPKMKSFVMSLFLLSVSLGNVLTAVVNVVIQNPDGSSKLAGASYFLFFAGLLGAAAVVLIPIAFLYKERTHLQGQPAALDAEPA